MELLPLADAIPSPRTAAKPMSWIRGNATRRNLNSTREILIRLGRVELQTQLTPLAASAMRRKHFDAHLLDAPLWRVEARFASA